MSLETPPPHGALHVTTEKNQLEVIPQRLETYLLAKPPQPNEDNANISSRNCAIIFLLAPWHSY